MSHLLLILSIAAAGACGALLLPPSLFALRRFARIAQARARFLEEGARIPGSAGAADTRQASLVRNLGARSKGMIGVVAAGCGIVLSDLLRNGVRPFRLLAQALIRSARVARVLQREVSALRIRGFVSGTQQVCELLLLIALAGFILVWLLSGIALVGLCAAVLFVMLTANIAERTLREWESRLREQIPEALRSIGLCFSAGYSLQQALEQTAAETPDPLGAELWQAVCDVAAGRSIEEALGSLEQRTSAAELRFAIVALEVQHRTGGSLQELLESAASAVLAAGDLRRQLSVQTAQARLSARIVALMPLVLIAVLSLAMEGYLQAFFSSFAGLAILVVALGMELAGVLSIRRILGIDLE
ncbi:MAG: type II secretion system F family protein [Coriobacteriales bacterium]|jgi:tight adherence protein B|nr:type II secretion system F family protein [Coriobacteriales bacterium]